MTDVPSTDAKPSVVVLAGSNGAGKSTAAPLLLRDTLSLTRYVNADVIAQGLAGFDPLSAALEAGRIMLDRIHELARQRLDFSLETTLASRSLAPFLRDLSGAGWSVSLFFLWLGDADLAVQRVAHRVASGGHHVPEETVRRRYVLGIRNFFSLYQAIASKWYVYDNSEAYHPRLIARGSNEAVLEVADPADWERFQEIGR
jgi:predicted ABC-type ATPase